MPETPTRDPEDATRAVRVETIETPDEEDETSGVINERVSIRLATAAQRPKEVLPLRQLPLVRKEKKHAQRNQTTFVSSQVGVWVQTLKPIA